MGLPQPWISHQDEVFGAGQVTSLSQFQKGGLGDILNRSKVVVGEFLEKRELCPLDSRLDAFGFSISDFCLAEGQQKALKREARSRGILRVGLVQLEEHGEIQRAEIGF